nr:radical SAM protein [Butyrivibrio sp. FC2001]
MKTEQEKLDMKTCMICPRKCGVDRTKGQLGYCRQPAHLTAARAYLHAWEEPCISGEKGSGTVFFSGCNMHCVFCQNSEIALGDVSKQIPQERLSEIFFELQEKGASNINLVTPTHFVPLIIPALENARNQGLFIPVVYNTSAYENVDTLKALEGLIDIYLPDCKYYSEELSLRYSNAPGYFETSIAVIDEMLRQVGVPKFFANRPIGANAYNLLMEESEDDYEGPLMKSGVIIRHLMLPGQLADSKKIVKELLHRYGDKVYLSIMNQFTPHGDLTGYPELLKGVNPDDYDELIDYAIELGLENGFFQGEGTDAESFIPAFDFEGL